MNKELLERIERLEQAIQEIWAACSCLKKDEEPNDAFNCEPPTCEDCGEMSCICWKELPEEKPEEDIDYE